MHTLYGNLSLVPNSNPGSAAFVSAGPHRRVALLMPPRVLQGVYEIYRGYIGVMEGVGILPQ